MWTDWRRIIIEWTGNLNGGSTKANIFFLFILFPIFINTLKIQITNKQAWCRKAELKLVLKYRVHEDHGPQLDHSFSSVWSSGFIAPQSHWWSGEPHLLFYPKQNQLSTLSSFQSSKKLLFENSSYAPTLLRVNALLTYWQMVPTKPGQEPEWWHQTVIQLFRGLRQKDTVLKAFLASSKRRSQK